MMDQIQKNLIQEIADLHTMPEGAYNIRANSQLAVCTDVVCTFRHGVEISDLLNKIFLNLIHHD